MSQEKLLWYQKSCRDWIKYEDQSTSFFHQKTIIRRAHNRITAIKDDGGTWLYDTQDIKSHVVTLFSTLYTSDQDTYQPYHVQEWFSQIDHTRLANLAILINNEEMHQAVF